MMFNYRDDLVAGVSGITRESGVDIPVAGVWSLGASSGDLGLRALQRIQVVVDNIPGLRCVHMIAHLHDKQNSGHFMTIQLEANIVRELGQLLLEAANTSESLIVLDEIEV